ncbi:MAG: dihydrofolate reductase [bacterium]
MLSIIVAIAENNAIGIKNEMPWHIPEDFKHFKETTLDHTIVMGEKTFESIGRALPGRKNVIMTLLEDYTAEGTTIIHSIDELLEMAKGDEEVFVIGGATIYKLALPYADKLYLTLVKTKIDGDAFFPSVDLENTFQVVKESELLFSEKQGLHYRFVEAVRK